MGRQTSLATLAILLSLTASAGGQRPTFRADTDLVTFGVTVTDRSGAFVADLTASDFEVVENGHPQPLQLFVRGDAADVAPPLHLGLLFDTSASMGENIQLARSAAIKFLNTLTEARDITLVDFDTEVRVAKYGQADFPRMVERIRSRKPAGMTALYDALGVYLDGASEDQGRTILLLYTDGGDTRSATAFSGIMDLVRASDVTIYAIGFLEQLPSSIRSDQRMRLQQLAGETGGHVVFPQSMKDVDKAYVRIVAQMRAQYTLGYVSSHASADGTWRRVDIKVRAPDGRALKLHARKGYYAPYRQEAGGGGQAAGSRSK